MDSESTKRSARLDIRSKNGEAFVCANIPYIGVKQ
jgi:hypothetical protein